jgi:hypothetical protein
MAALDQTHGVRGRLREPIVQHALHPGSGRIDDRLCANLLAVGERGRPQAMVAPCRNALGARQYAHAALARVHRVGDHQARVVDAAVRIDEAVLQVRLQTGAIGRCVQAHCLGARQARAPREVIVEE